MLNWDDLRVFGVTARCGSLAAAATQLGMDPSTVGRRVMRLESHLKSTLLVRSSSGLQLTPSGIDLQQIALRVEAAMEPTCQAGGAGAVSGVVRISLPEALGGGVFIARMLESAARFKNLVLEFAINRGEVQFGRGEMDMAVTTSPPKPAGLVVEEVGRFELGLFATRQYLRETQLPTRCEDIGAMRFVRHLDDALNGGDGLLGDLCARTKACMTSASLPMHLQLLLSGAGFGLLPCFVGEAAGLQQILPRQLKTTRSLWLSTDRELADTARTRAVRGWLVAAIAAQTENATAPMPPATGSVLPFAAQPGTAVKPVYRREGPAPAAREASRMTLAAG